MQTTRERQNGKLTSGYEKVNKPKIKKEERMVKKKGEREKKQQQHFLKRKRRQVMSVSNGLDTRNPCTRYNPLSSDNNTAGQQTLTNYSTQRKNERSR